MTGMARVNTTLDSDLVERLDAYARARREDRSTAIRQLLDAALRAVEEQEAVDAYRDGRLTLRELAARLGTDVWAAQDVLAARGVAVDEGARAETRVAFQAALATLGGDRPRRTRRPR